MSQELVALVLGLEPPARRAYHLKGEVHARDRHLLLTLAALADDQGKATVSLGELQGLTLMHLSVLHGARASLVAQNFFLRHPGSSEYQLDLDTLRGRQSGVEVRLRAPIYHLADYGLPTRTINTLVHREGLHTVDDLNRRLAEWRSRTDCDNTPEGLARYLDIPMLGKGKCESIIAAVASWNADHDQ